MTANAQDTITLFELFELETNKRLGRVTDAAERAADALGRIAASFEKLAELAASVIGTGNIHANAGEAFATKRASYKNTSPLASVISVTDKKIHPPLHHAVGEALAHSEPDVVHINQNE